LDVRFPTPLFDGSPSDFCPYISAICKNNNQERKKVVIEYIIKEEKIRA
jgi:hypothetical protein